MFARRPVRSSLGAAPTRGWRWLLFGLGLCLAVPAPSTGQVGVLVGSQRDRLRGLEPAMNFGITETSTDFHIGVFLNLGAGAFAVRPAVVFHRMKDFTIVADPESFQFDVDLVEVPLDVRFGLPVAGVRPYLVAGPTLTFPSADDDRIDERLTKRQFRFDVGVGLELALGFRLWPEVRYGRALSSFLDADGIAIGDTTFPADGESRLDTFMLRLGISF